MTANPRSPQNFSSSESSGAAPTTNAQNFAPNSRCTSRCCHHRPAIRVQRARHAAALQAERRAPGRRSLARRRGAQHVLRSTSRIFGTDTSTDTRRGPDLVDDVARVVAAHEHDDAGQHRRNERRHRLAEHVAERQQVEEPDRAERFRVASGTSAPRVRPARCSPARCGG